MPWKVVYQWEVGRKNEIVFETEEAAHAEFERLVMSQREGLVLHEIDVVEVGGEDDAE